MKPLCTVKIGSHPVRFYRTPLDDGRPDLPWVSFSDVFHAANLPNMREVKKSFFSQFGKDIGQKAGDDAVPFMAASGILVVAGENLWQQHILDVAASLQIASAQAWKLIVDDISPNERLHFAIEATSRWDGTFTIGERVVDVAIN